jgi:uncharacterized LabA/DUF88 family protein
LTTGAAGPIIGSIIPSRACGLTGHPRVAIRGFFLAVNRTAFLIDGFNRCHSLREAAKATSGRGSKWLDVRALCESYLHVIGAGATLCEVRYFSALATHLEVGNPKVTQRHRDFIACIGDTGVEVELSRFKRKTIRCEHCGEYLRRHEEKETDVAIACRLLEALSADRADTVVMLSGDTDLAPAARIAKQLFPAKTIAFAFPFGRKNKELAQIVDASFQIARGQYMKHQLPDPYVLRSGRAVAKPLAW